MSLSIVLTVHNKQAILRAVMDALIRTTVGPFEMVVVLDGCKDRSAAIMWDYVRAHAAIPWQVRVTKDVFETRANNVGLRAATGEHVVIVQDDQVMDEVGWNERLLAPFKSFDDVFAVTGRAAHNWMLNEQAVDRLDSPHREDRWCDLLVAVDVADASNTRRGVFAVRDSANRGPLVIDHADLEALGYLDEAFAPQDSDEHDLMYRMHAKLGKQVGCVPVGWHSRPEWGGTRDAAGKTRPWMFAANHRNARLLHARHAEAMLARRREDRTMP